VDERVRELIARLRAARDRLVQLMADDERAFQEV
jgi:formiminotetrahydrofolate cyclodeaminase